MGKRVPTHWVIRHYERGLFIGFLYGKPAFDNDLKKHKSEIRRYLSTDEAVAVLNHFQKLYPKDFNKCFVKRIDVFNMKKPI